MDELKHTLDEQFGRLHARTLALTRAAPPDVLYRQPARDSSLSGRGAPAYSCGEHLLRSAGIVEQTFGGIESNLWDDPFEWALPELLPTPERLAAYLAEVEETRRRGFALFRDDSDLFKEIAVPSGGTRTLAGLLVETLTRAAHQQGRAFATFRLFSAAPLPRD